MGLCATGVCAGVCVCVVGVEGADCVGGVSPVSGVAEEGVVGGSVDVVGGSVDVVCGAVDAPYR